MHCLCNFFKKLEKEGDPPKGLWSVACTPKIVLWTKVSQIAMGVALEVDGDIIEDAAWLRKKEDCSHLNMSELDAVIKGINLATRWNPSCIELMVDSATVKKWTVKQRFSSAYRPQGNGLAERVHRTVKRTVARTFCTVEKAVFWINATKADESKLLLFKILFRARPRREWIKKPVEESEIRQGRGMPESTASRRLCVFKTRSWEMGNAIRNGPALISCQR